MSDSRGRSIGVAAAWLAAVSVPGAGAQEGGAITAAGPRDFASMVQFSSSAAASTLIKATDVSELQSAVNALRVATGLAATTFSPPAGLISAAHLNSLRTAITQARSAFGMATSFSDPTITPGTTKVRAVHWQDLREGLK